MNNFESYIFLKFGFNLQKFLSIGIQNLLLF